MFDINDWFLLNNLSEEVKNEIVSGFSKAKKYKKGECIYSPDRFSRAIGVFLSGKAEAKSENVLKRSFSQGETFGVAAIFGDETPYISEITAKTDCTVQFVSEKELRDLIKTHPEIAGNYISFLSDRVRFLNRKISVYTCKSVSARLYRFLVDNADENNTVNIVSMSSLAKQTSIGRTSLYRAMDSLVDDGMIERNGSTVTIKNV